MNIFYACHCQSAHHYLQMCTRKVKPTYNQNEITMISIDRRNHVRLTIRTNERDRKVIEDPQVGIWSRPSLFWSYSLSVQFIFLSFNFLFHILSSIFTYAMSELNHQQYFDTQCTPSSFDLYFATFVCVLNMSFLLHFYLFLFSCLFSIVCVVWCRANWMHVFILNGIRNYDVNRTLYTVCWNKISDICWHIVNVCMAISYLACEIFARFRAKQNACCTYTLFRWIWSD